MLLLALTLLLLGAPPPQQVYVLADVARLRVEPKEAAATVERLRIGTGLTALSKKGDWTQVQWKEGVAGWIKSDLVVEHRLTLESAVANARAATGAARIKWLERAVAVDGSDAGVWQQLRTAYLQADLKEKARQADNMLNARTPIYFAACQGVADGTSFAVLLAVYEPGKGLRSLSATGNVTGVWDPAPAGGLPAELERLKQTLGSESWFGVGGDGRVIPFVGTPFAAPAFEDSTSAGGSTRVLKLGPCDDEVSEEQPPQLYATFPLAVVPSTATFDWSRAGDVAHALKSVGVLSDVTSLRVTRVEGTPAFYDVTASSTVWALFDSKLRLAPCTGDCGQGKAIGPISADPTWLQPAFGSSTRFGIGRYADPNNTAFTLVEVGRGGELRFVYVTTSQGGC